MVDRIRLWMTVVVLALLVGGCTKKMTFVNGTGQKTEVAVLGRETITPFPAIATLEPGQQAAFTYALPPGAGTSSLTWKAGPYIGDILIGGGQNAPTIVIDATRRKLTAALSPMYDLVDQAIAHLKSLRGGGASLVDLGKHMADARACADDARKALDTAKGNDLKAVDYDYNKGLLDNLVLSIGEGYRKLGDIAASRGSAQYITAARHYNVAQDLAKSMAQPSANARNAKAALEKRVKSIFKATFDKTVAANPVREYEEKPMHYHNKFVSTSFGPDVFRWDLRVESPVTRDGRRVIRRESLQKSSSLKDEMKLREDSRVQIGSLLFVCKSGKTLKELWDALRVLHRLTP